MSRTLDAKLVAIVKNELQLRETDDLLEIWLANDRTEYTAEAFEAIRQLLQERLGAVPPQYDGPATAALRRRQAQQHLEQAEALDARGQHANALDEVEAALQLDPRLAAAHHLRGLLLDANGHLLEAIRAYTQALRLDPQLAGVAEDLREAEREWAEVDAALIEPATEPQPAAETEPDTAPTTEPTPAAETDSEPSDT